MTIVVGSRGNLSGDILAEIQRLESLVQDLRRLADGMLPTAGELAEAPLIEGWRLAERAVPCLVGVITGHPHIQGPRGITTDLWVFAPDLGWARTLSRFYRTGAAHQGNAERIAGGGPEP